jgi:hypothetical protein
MNCLTEHGHIRGVHMLCFTQSFATVSNWAMSLGGTFRVSFRTYDVGSPVFSAHTDNIASRQLSPYLTTRPSALLEAGISKPRGITQRQVK